MIKMTISGKTTFIDAVCWPNFWAINSYYSIHHMAAESRVKNVFDRRSAAAWNENVYERQSSLEPKRETSSF